MPEAAQSTSLASLVYVAIAVALLLGVAISIAFVIRRRTNRDFQNTVSIAPDSEFGKALTLFGEAMQPDLLARSGLRLIAQFFQARYGLILAGPDDEGRLVLVEAIDTKGKREPSGPPLQGKVLPEITSTLVRGRAKVLRKEQEIAAVREVLGLNPTGEAMIAPVALENERNGGMLLLASPDRPNWSPGDMETLKAWASYLGRRINAPTDILDSSRAENADILKGELRLALEELAEVSAVESGDSMAQVGTLTSRLMEMREPIRSIQGHSEMLRIGDVDSGQVEFLDQIAHDIGRLDRQLTALLDLVRTPQTPVRSQVEISKILDIAEAQVNTDLHESEISVVRDFPRALPQVSADGDLLRQVLVVLLERAIQISPNGSQIGIAAEADEGGWVSVAISDQGPGVPAEDLGRVFHISEGALPQVKAIMDTLGGKVWIASEMGAGSTVTVLIPISEAPVARSS